MFSASARSKVEVLVRTITRDAGLNLTFRMSSCDESILTVVFDGLHVRYLLARNAELLLALEHIAGQALRLTSEQHELICFDAGGFKGERDRTIRRWAQEAVEQVRSSGALYRFRPMNSRERRLLHLALASSGLVSQSEGEGAERHLVVHPRRANQT
jgi:spoIIIJ-associated protein